MKKTLIILTTSLLVSSSAFAAPVFEFGLSRTKESIKIPREYNEAKLDKLSASYEAIHLAAGYEFDINSSFSVTPLLGISKGLNNEKFTDLVNVDSGIHFDAEAENERTISLGINGRYTFDNGVFASASYSYGWSKAKVTLTAQGTDVSGSIKTNINSGSYGAGVGYEFSDKLSFEVDYFKNADDSHVDSIVGLLRYSL